MLMWMGQHTGCNHAAVRRHDLPAICIMIPTAVGMPQCDVQIESADLRRGTNIDLQDIGLAGLQRLEAEQRGRR